MSKKPERRGLGRGLSALMADVGPAEEKSPDAPARKADLRVPIERVFPNPDQPRRHFADEALQELAASIREKGVIQPLIVRPSKVGDGTYEIVAGERRWRASQMAQIHDVPVIVREFDDIEVLEVAIIENIQRADLNPVEEAQGYRQLMERFGHTQEKLAEALSKSRSHIANLMRLLQLPDDVLNHLREGRLSAGHARALITCDDPSALAKIVVAKGLSVRDTEKLAKGDKSPKVKGAAKPGGGAKEKDADTRALELDLSANLKMRVEIDHPPGQEAGRITVSYDNLDQLDELCRILSSV
jgi:ParB family transcriptional regulator, chromosome partitioning protein